MGMNWAAQIIFIYFHFSSPNTLISINKELLVWGSLKIWYRVVRLELLPNIKSVKVDCLVPEVGSHRSRIDSRLNNRVI